MSIFKKKIKALAQTGTSHQMENQSFDKLAIYVTIVNLGQADAIVSLLKQYKSNAQFVQKGKGTATKNVLDILGYEDNSKEIVISLVRKDLISEIKQELQAFFEINQKNKGIAFSISIDSMIGITLYKFLSSNI